MEACKAGWLKNSFPFCIEIIHFKHLPSRRHVLGFRPSGFHYNPRGLSPLLPSLTLPLFVRGYILYKVPSQFLLFLVCLTIPGFSGIVYDTEEISRI